MIPLAACSIIAPLLILLIAEVRSGRFRRCMAPFLAVAGVWLFTCLGCLVVLNDPSLYSDRYVLSMVLVNVLCWVGYLLLVHGFGSLLHVEYREPLRNDSLAIPIVFFVCLWCFSAAMFALYYSRHGLPPIFAFARGEGFVDIYAVRAVKTTNIPEGMSWYALGLQTIPFLTFVYAYGLHLLRRTAASARLLAIVAVITVVLASMFANKGVILEMMSLVVVVRICVGSDVVRLRRIALYAVAGVASVFPFLRLYLLDRGLGAVGGLFGQYLLDRILFTYAKAHAYLVQIFPSEVPYLDGRGLPNPGGLLPFSPVNLSQFLAYYLTGGVANYSAPSFSRGYADFGYPGIVLIIAFIFVQAGALQIVFRRLPRQPIYMAVYALFASRMIMFGATSVFGPLGINLVVVLGFVVILHNVIEALLTRAPRAEQRSTSVTTKAPA